MAKRHAILRFTLCRALTPRLLPMSMWAHSHVFETWAKAEDRRRAQTPVSTEHSTHLHRKIGPRFAPWTSIYSPTEPRGQHVAKRFHLCASFASEFTLDFNLCGSSTCIDMCCAATICPVLQKKTLCNQKPSMSSDPSLPRFL